MIDLAVAVDRRASARGRRSSRPHHPADRRDRRHTRLSALVFTVNGKFPIGDFVNAVVAFVLVSAAIYSRRRSHERGRGPNAPGTGPFGPDDQALPGLPQRGANRRPSLRVLHISTQLDIF